ncbi:MAG: hypothetical protein A3E84_04200 [Gammaproteobacteria bacterium RIFCSPHIGHO2_12_FULL_42_13]|nr:MAG: hypothetical protein A3E84_04200 [Gammaproteobacteria bacterium RIFCSPHIGHO2_12_FULL_42_13]
MDIKLVHYSFQKKQPQLYILRDDTLYTFSPAIDSFETLVNQAEHAKQSLYAYTQALKTTLVNHPFSHTEVLIPFVPPEVWGAGVTYERSREARNIDEQTTSSIYDRAYEATRPELFFKATPHRCVGPNAFSGIRADAKQTVPEAELCVVVGKTGEILAYSLGNDMNARDLEGENPLYLPQAKIHAACFSFGPALLLCNNEAHPDFSIECKITRNEEVVFEGKTHTSKIRRPLSELIDYLRRMGVPPLTVMATGTGIVPPVDFALQENDVIQISSERIGTLSNIVRHV